MSSSGRIKIDDVKERERLIRLSNLPLAALDVNTQKVAGRDASAYIEYLKSPVYAEDLGDNRLGIHLYGKDAATRSQLFLLTAKGLALNERPVWFCSALYLCRTLESSDDERIKKLGTVGNLFIENFEVRFGDGGCPFTYYQRLLMEEFLASRQRANLVTNYSTSVNWSELTWWSSDFLSSQAASIRNFSI